VCTAHGPPGDVVVIEATVRRAAEPCRRAARSRVDGHAVVEGTMTFALGPRTDGAEASAQHE
jgi:hypothetical protein